MFRRILVAFLAACVILAWHVASTRAIQEGQADQTVTDAASAFPVRSGTIYFSGLNGPDLFDLDTGEVCTSRTPCSAAGSMALYDLDMSFLAGVGTVSIVRRDACSTEEPLEQAALWFLDGTLFESVADSSIATASYLSSLSNPILQPGDTLIVKTCEGDYFKVGNVICNVLATPGTYPRCENASAPYGAATFDYQRLR